MTARAGKPVLNGLQLVRGAAAMMVVAFHISLFFGPTSFIAGTDFGRVFLFGHAGVDLFFVLSGYIIMYNHIDDTKNPHNLRQFVLKRLIRLYPPVMLTVFACIVFLPVMRWITRDPTFFSITPTQALSSFFLVPATCSYVPGTLWSLQNEMYFYAVFCLSYLSVGLFLSAMTVWTILSLAFGTSVFASCTSYPLSLFNCLFIGGVFAYFAKAWLLKYEWRVARPMLWLGLMTFATAAIFDVRTLSANMTGLDIASPDPRLKLAIRALYGIASVAIVTAAAMSEWKSEGLFGRLGLLLGNASFAIYLVHLPIAGTLIRPLHAFAVDSVPGATSIFALLIIVCAIAGVTFHILIERPLIDTLNRAFVRSKKRKL